MNRIVTFLSIWFLIIGPLCRAQKFQVDTLQKTGPLNQRINVVILGDGYTESQLAKFDADAKAFVSFFLGYTPYDAYKNYFNFFTIRTPSNESGATNPGTAPDRYPTQPIETKDTYYGSAFGSNNIHRLVVIKKYQAFTNVMATNFPGYDLAILIVNSPWYGGSGGNPATFTTNEAADLIGVHEVGHNFSRLTDEYWAGTVYAREGANMSKSNNPATITWKNWINQFNVGVYPHTGASDAGSWYKPTTRNCLMEQLDKPFCAVCREATTNRILQLVEPILSVQPLPDSRVIVKNTPEPFQLTFLKPNPNTLKVEWRLNDVLINRDSAQVLIANEQLPNQTNTLSVSVLDTTAYIRLESHRQQNLFTHRWTLEKATITPTLAISASKRSVCTEESATLTAENCPGSVSWSSGATGSSIVVSPTQSTTYSVHCTLPDGIVQTATVSVAVFPLPVPEAGNTGPYVEGQTVQLTAQGGASYAWSGPASFTSSEQNPKIIVAKLNQAGSYTVAVTSATGCVSRAQTVVSISPLLAVTISSVDAIWVFPNPAKGSVQIRTALKGELEVTLFNEIGHEVLKKLFYQSIELSTEKLPKAVYIYRVSNGQKTMTGKLVVE